jgi:CubicO group peptidase (beta-lactamase class C family)
MRTGQRIAISAKVFFILMTIDFKAILLRLVVGLTLTGCTVPLTAIKPKGTMNNPALDQALSAMLKNTVQPIVSVSALAIKDGQVVYHNQFGRRSIEDTASGLKELPVDHRTLFRIASISKLVTTIGVMKLVEEGKLNLDEDVSQLLGWKFRNPNFSDDVITLRHLLTHRSSLTDGPGMYWWDVGVDLKEVLVPGGKLYKANEYWSRDKAPATWYQYVNFNFGVIATLMEKASGERFDRLMQRLVLTPLQMRGGFNPADFPAADVADIAVQYRKRRNEGSREVWDPKGPWVVQADDFAKTGVSQPPNIAQYVVGTNGTVFGPQGRLRVSVADLSQLMSMLLNQGKHRQLQFLKPETLALMVSEQWRYDPNKPNGDTMGEGTLAWSLGIQKFIDQGKDRVTEGGGFSGYGHYGDAYGLMGTFAFDPARKIGQIVVITGPGINPDKYPSQFSTMYRWEEIANSAVYKLAIQP